MSENRKKENLLKSLDQLSQLVDPIIKELLGLNVSKEFKKIIEYQLSAGGKRLRPAFLLLSCYLLNGKTEDAIYPAAGIEILHNYTLIIDDIIDKSPLRRGRPTVWKEYGKSMAEFISTFYVSSAFQATQMSRNPVLTSQIFSKTLKEINEGQIMDALFERNGRNDEPFFLKNRYSEISKKKYLKMIKKKTAVLFQASCEMGGICANGSEKEIELLKLYGFNMGMAFQIQDDILDIFGKEKDFGKQIGKDIEESKGGNIVILLALEELNSKDKDELLKILFKRKNTKKEIEKAVILIKKTKAKEKAEKMGKNYIKKSMESLNQLPKNKWQEVLFFLTNFIMKREK